MTVLAEAMVLAEMDETIVLAQLDRHLPELPNRWLTLPWEFDHRHLDIVVRAHRLRSLLTGRTLQPEDLMRPPSDDEDAEGFSRRNRNERVYGLILPWYRLRAEVLLRRVDADSAKERAAALGRSISERHFSLREDEGGFLANRISALWWETLIRAQAADEAAARSVKSWLDGIASPGYASTWTRMAWLCARAGVDRLALRFAQLTDAVVQATDEDADTTAHMRLDLARALMPLSQDEAGEYPELALCSLEGRLGNESRIWLDTLLLVADRAGDPREPEPMLAFRLARATEQVNRQNDHEFRWLDVSARLRALCPSAAFAICGRWQDRRAVDLSESLSGFVSDLVRQGLISVGQALSLWTLAPGWNRNGLLDACLTRERDPERQQALLESFVKEGAVAPPDHYRDRGLQSVARRHGLSSETLDALVLRPPDPEARKQRQWESQLHLKNEANAGPEPLQGDFTRSEEIERVIGSWRRNARFNARELLALGMAEAVPVRDRGAHLDAWLSTQSLPAIDVLFSLREIRKAWDTPAMRNRVDKAIQALVSERADELITSGFSLGFLLGRPWDGKRSEIEPDLRPLIEAADRHVAWLGAETLFQLAKELGLRLDKGGARDVLDFGLQCLEQMPAARVGDGEWREFFEPPGRIEDAVAGLIWARLGAPEAAERWRGAHAVRRLANEGEASVLSAMIALMDSDSDGAFVDARLPFYSLHARLYRLNARDPRPIAWRVAFSSALTGTLSHLLLDSLMHVDMSPLAPLVSGTVLAGALSFAVDWICIVTGVIGAAVCLWSAARSGALRAWWSDTIQASGEKRVAGSGFEPGDG